MTDMTAYSATENEKTDELRSETVPLGYTLHRLLAHTIGADAAASHALTKPGLAGIVRFCAARGDEAEAVAEMLGMTLAEVEGFILDDVAR